MPKQKKNKFDTDPFDVSNVFDTPGVPEQAIVPEQSEPIISEQPEIPGLPATPVTQTRVPLTEGIREVQQKQEEVGQRQAEALTALTQAKQAGAQEQAEILTSLDQETQTLDQKRAEVEQQFNTELQTELSNIQTRREELLKKEPKSFWQKADTSDKLLMALSVLVGGIGQGLSGSRTNAAIDAMNRAIDLDLQQQNKLLDRQLKGLDQKKMDLTMKSQIQNRLLNEMDARKGAALGHARRLIERASLSTQNAESKAILQQKLAELDQSMLEEDAALQEKLAGRITTQTVVGGSPDQTQSFEQLPKDVQSAVKIVSDKNSNIVAIRNEIASALDDLKNPKVSREDKLRIGAGLVKTLNSTQGSDAVGAEEAKRLASELEGNVSKVAQQGAIGATGGAVAGAPFGGPIGAAIAGGIGLVGGAISGLLDAMDDPGGIRLRADVDGFTKRVELTMKKLDSTLKRNDISMKLMKKGKSPVEAAQQADKILEASLRQRKKK